MLREEREDKETMKGQLMISEIAIAMKEDTDKKYIYGSLFDFYADTEENLKRFTDTMYDNGLFSFSNIGPYEGIDDRTHMHWTLDDGKPSIQWLLKVFQVVEEMNKNGDKIEVTINKKFLMDNKAVDDLTLKNGDKPGKMESLIDLYIYHLKEIMERGGYGSLLKTQVKGKLSKSIPSRLEDDRIVIES